MCQDYKEAYVSWPFLVQKTNVEVREDPVAHV